MQPSLDEWLRHARCTLQDCDSMELWTPDPFTHFKCTIGDLLLHKRPLTPATLVRCGLTVRVLRERYGLTPDLMCALLYAPKEWYDLGLSTDDVNCLTDAQLERIFGTSNRLAIMARLPPRGMTGDL